MFESFISSLDRIAHIDWEEPRTRRAALRGGSLATLAALLAACGTDALLSDQGTPKPTQRNMPTHPPKSTDIPAVTATSTLEPTITSIPDATVDIAAQKKKERDQQIAARKVLLSTEEFFLLDEQGGHIMACERDDTEFETLKPDIDRDSAIRNACGSACLKMGMDIESMFEKKILSGLHTGDIINTLEHQTYQIGDQSYPFFTANHEMYMYGLREAISVLDPERIRFKTSVFHKLSSPVENFHFKCDLSGRMVEYCNAVFDNGGFVIWGAWKYGVTKGTVGHFVLVTKIKSGDGGYPVGTIIDPMTGKMLKDQAFENYWDSVPGEIMPTMGIIGVMPSSLNDQTVSEFQGNVQVSYNPLLTYGSSTV